LLSQGLVTIRNYGDLSCARDLGFASNRDSAVYFHRERWRRSYALWAGW